MNNDIEKQVVWLEDQLEMLATSKGHNQVVPQFWCPHPSAPCLWSWVSQLRSNTRSHTNTANARAHTLTHSHKIPGSQHLFLQAACNPTLCKAFSNSTIDISSLRRLTKPVPWPSTSACLIDKGCVLEIFCSLSALMLYQVSESASMKIWR